MRIPSCKMSIARPERLPGVDTAHVAPMAPHGREQQKFFLHKNRTKHQYIVEVRTSGIWIIVQEDIAWIDVIFEIVDDFSSRKWHGKDMDRIIVK